MNLKEVRKVVGDTPYMSFEQGRRLTEFISSQGIAHILELGFAHGVSTCFMLAAVSDKDGDIVTIDLNSARERNPNIEELLGRIGDREKVTIHYEPTSYTWRLMKLLEEDPEPQFEMCYLDGAHSWFVDGFAFFLVDLLLKPGGWIVFDDVDWTFSTSDSLKNTLEVKEMPWDERTTPQIRKVYELLVRPHPNYHNFRIEYNWAFAQKKDYGAASISDKNVIVEKEVVWQEKHVGIGWFLAKVAKKLTGQ